MVTTHFVKIRFLLMLAIVEKFNKERYSKEQFSYQKFLIVRKVKNSPSKPPLWSFIQIKLMNNPKTHLYSEHKSKSLETYELNFYNII